MKCALCPRECGADRSSAPGFCQGGKEIKIAKYMLHHWEEPPISGVRGSGAVFFSGCPLKCVYCQNKDISQGGIGYEISKERLSEIFLELQRLGAHNINLVSPTHYSDGIIEALELSGDRLNIPVVYNTGGYEKSEIIKNLGGCVDIYLTDMKYFSSELSSKYSRAPDYFEKSISALCQMVEQQPKAEFDENGIMQRGVIIRHLVLPSHRQDSIALLSEIRKHIDIKNVKLSLMSQYTPDFYNGESKALRRRVTTFEYESVVSHAIDLGYDGYIQEKSSATSIYTPDFSKNTNHNL